MDDFEDCKDLALIEAIVIVPQKQVVESATLAKFKDHDSGSLIVLADYDGSVNTFHNVRVPLERFLFCK